MGRLVHVFVACTLLWRLLRQFCISRQAWSASRLEVLTGLGGLDVEGGCSLRSPPLTEGAWLEAVAFGRGGYPLLLFTSGFAGLQEASAVEVLMMIGRLVVEG